MSRVGTFGLIFHWGRYSVYEFDVPNTKRKIGNGSEWYEHRRDSHLPTSDNKATQDHFRRHFADKAVGDIDKMFNQEKKSGPKEWIQFAKSIGATYVILTAKHHDGFCLWPTKTTPHCATQDWIGEFVQAAREQGLKVGFYYSWYEFAYSSCSRDYLDTIVSRQLRKLATYKPDIWWFDGHWVCKTKIAHERIQGFVRQLKQSNPEVEINDRVTDLKQATYRVYRDRYIPETTPDGPWEHINTVGLSWGRNAQQKPEHYKTPQQLMALYKEVLAKKGRFLLNMGPSADGVLDREECMRLIEFSRLIKSE